MSPCTGFPWMSSANTAATTPSGPQKPVPVPAIVTKPSKTSSTSKEGDFPWMNNPTVATTTTTPKTTPTLTTQPFSTTGSISHSKFPWMKTPTSDTAPKTTLSVPIETTAPYQNKKRPPTFPWMVQASAPKAPGPSGGGDNTGSVTSGSKPRFPWMAGAAGKEPDFKPVDALTATAATDGPTTRPKFPWMSKPGAPLQTAGTDANADADDAAIGDADDDNGGAAGFPWMAKRTARKPGGDSVNTVAGPPSDAGAGPDGGRTGAGGSKFPWMQSSASTGTGTQPKGSTDASTDADNNVANNTDASHNMAGITGAKVGFPWMAKPTAGKPSGDSTNTGAAPPSDAGVGSDGGHTGAGGSKFPWIQSSGSAVTGKAPAPGGAAGSRKVDNIFRGMPDSQAGTGRNKSDVTAVTAGAGDSSGGGGATDSTASSGGSRFPWMVSSGDSTSKTGAVDGSAGDGDGVAGDDGANSGGDAAKAQSFTDASGSDPMFPWMKAGTGKSTSAAGPAAGVAKNAGKVKVSQFPWMNKQLVAAA